MNKVHKHAQCPVHSKAPEMLAAAVVVSMIFSFNDLVLILTGSGSQKHRGSPQLLPLSIAEHMGRSP